MVLLSCSSKGKIGRNDGCYLRQVLVSIPFYVLRYENIGVSASHIHGHGYMEVSLVDPCFDFFLRQNTWPASSRIVDPDNETQKYMILIYTFLSDDMIGSMCNFGKSVDMSSFICY